MLHVWNIYLQNWVILVVNVGKHSKHGAYGYLDIEIQKFVRTPEKGRGLWVDVTQKNMELAAILSPGCPEKKTVWIDWFDLLIIYSRIMFLFPPGNKTGNL